MLFGKSRKGVEVASPNGSYLSRSSDRVYQSGQGKAVVGLGAKQEQGEEKELKSPSRTVR